MNNRSLNLREKIKHLSGEAEEREQVGSANTFPESKKSGIGVYAYFSVF